mgnify:CR=1 FL=1
MKKLLILASVTSIASASQAAFFDWENLPAFVSASSYSQTDGGITATASAPGAMVEAHTQSVTGFGSRALLGVTPNYSAVRIDFDTALASISVQAGDNGFDADPDIQMEAYTAGDLLVGSDIGSIAENVLDPITLTVTGADIAFVILSSGGDFPNTVYWDNMTANPVPEPATMALLGLGAVAVLRRRIRR